MSGKITGFLREYIVVLSSIVTVIGIFFLFMGISWYWIRSLVQPPTTQIHFIYTLGEWNAYTLVAGLVIFGIGVYYLYSFLKKRKFVTDELRTDKRSEILKKRAKLEATAKHLPSKYQRLLAEKEDELNIK
jgi:putative Mn2+ efflux pump MntP